MKTRNRLFSFWQQLEIIHNKRINQAKLGEILGGYSQSKVSRWLSHEDEPERDTLYVWYKNLLQYFPNLHMEELIEEAPE